MQRVNYPQIQDLVLVGGGHSHVLCLKKFGMNPLLGLRLILISETPHTPYSGMLPGYLAGFYDYDQTHIDLHRLCRQVGAEFYCDQALGLDLVKKQVICHNHPPVAFDFLSLDIGSTPAQNQVPGAQEYSIPIKPVAPFLVAWQEILHRISTHASKQWQLVIVGGGAGGVELVLNLQAKLKQTFPCATGETLRDRVQFHLIHRGETLMTGHSASVSQRVTQLLRQRHVQLYCGETVQSVTPTHLNCTSGLQLAQDVVFWVTQASAPPWIAASALATDDRGFMLVQDTLQSSSHPFVFGAGDIATMVNHPRPKAGVFAVRQGKPLFENLRRFALSRPLKPFHPQKCYLALIGTGEGSAIASWHTLSAQHPLLWQWKDSIDRQFMAQFEPRNPPLHPSTPQALPLPPEQPLIYCAGCGSKVGHETLQRVLQRLEIPTSIEVVIGLDSPDDAAVLSVPRQGFLVHTLDYFRSFLNDPFIFGQIATNHSLSDLFAMGATPQSVLALATLPHGIPQKQEEMLYQLLSGALRVLEQTHTPLVGGHTLEGDDFAFGLACQGIVTPDRLLRKTGMQPGQHLILTQALGTGTLFAADMQGQAKGRWIQGAIAAMLKSNYPAAQIFLQHKASACTDITGFGLLGHLGEMVQASGVAVTLHSPALPILEGALATLEAGFFSSLHRQNLRYAALLTATEDLASQPYYPLLFDPQTAGGLLAALPSDQVDACLQALHQVGYTQATLIGEVQATTTPQITVEI